MSLPKQSSLQDVVDAVKSDDLPMTLTIGGPPSHVVDKDEQGWFVARLEIDEAAAESARTAALENGAHWMPEMEWQFMAPGVHVLEDSDKEAFLDSFRRWWSGAGSSRPIAESSSEAQADEQQDQDESDEPTSYAMSLAHQFLAYLVAIVAAIAAGWAWHDAFASHLLLSLFVADVVGTIVVFGFSRLHDNSSLYDPYWSVAPIVIAFAFVYLSGDVGAAQWACVGAVCVWGVRLTYNFFSGWPGLHHEDWRYQDFREQFPCAYWFVSFAGVHFFPTLLVFAGCFPLYATFFGSDAGIVALQAAGVAVMLLATGIEALADKQLREFVRSKPPRGTIMEEGIWRYSRHPNYFGELTFWWGLWIFGAGTSPADWLWTLSGPAAMTLLFVFVSIPLLDKRSLKRRDGYAEHMKRVSGLVPLPRRDA